MATLQNTTINSTGFLTIPVGNTTQRPGSPTNGMLRFNTDTGQIEVYNSGATAWGSITGPTISQIQITDSGYNVLDDTAVNTAGGYIKITGTGFSAGAVVVIGGVNATSTTVVNSTILNVQVPAQVAGTYTVYVVNTNGGTAIGVNGLTYSALPNWVTGSSLPNGLSGSAISIQLNATDATSYALAPANTLPTGLTLTSGGLLSGTITVGSETTYSFTIIATDAELQDSPRAFTITISVGDPYFYLTTLLLAGNGTNNGTNNTFTDSSTNALAITRYGNTTQGTFSPFTQTGWSGYFDGTGDYLGFTKNTTTGSFTCECWFYRGDNVSNYHILFSGSDLGSPNADNIQLQVSNTGGVALTMAGSSVFAFTGTEVQQNAWNHIAWVRSGTSCAVFVNGSRIATGTSSAALNVVSIGTYLSGYQPIGYISNARIVNSAVYDPSLTTCTVPVAPLTAISGTYLLTLQNNRFIDNSTNNFTITRNGDVSVQPFEPFAPGSSYSSGTVGGSAFLDGNLDYLMPADSTATDLGLSQEPFTLEWWTYFTTTTGGQYIISKGGGAGAWNSTNGWQYLLSIELSSSVWSLGYYNGSSYTYWQPSYSSVGIFGRWNHMVLSYDGTNLSAFMNGTRIGTTTVTNFTKPSASNKCSIGSPYGVAGEAYYYNGYISGFRIVKGTAVYNPTLSTLTVPTAPPTAIANTSLLLNFTNGQILDSTSKNVLETLGDAKISTTQSKWGGSSIYFDGTGDQLSMRNYLGNYISGNENFTIEGWIYPTTSGSSYNSIYCNGYPIQVYYKSNNIECYCSSTNGASYFINGVSGPAASVATNAWSHFAFVRNGSTFTVYVNGVAGTPVTSSTAIALTNSTYSEIGNFLSIGAYGLSGYLNDLRITKGYARYTTNFTPPSGAFPTQ